MRATLLAVLALCSCTPLDPLIGTFNATVSGADTDTAPTARTTTVSSTATLVVTADKEHVGYLITVAEANYMCRLKAVKDTSATLQLKLSDGQTCQIGNATATLTSGTLSLDKDTTNTATFTVNYSYAYQLVVNFAGTGTRTYTGPRL
jgi:hypothetical protein